MSWIENRGMKTNWPKRDRRLRTKRTDKKGITNCKSKDSRMSKRLRSRKKLENRETMSCKSKG